MIPRRAVGWILAVATVAIVVANQEEVGIARDEAVYMDAGLHYADFWLHLPSKLSEDGITKTFGGKNATDNNREHPPFMKTLFGLSYRALHDGFGVDELASLRFPSAVMHGLCVLLVFLMVFELWGFAEAIAAALLLMFLPRGLFHASLATFDAPIMTLWFATVFAYWKALDGRKWPWQAGVVFGLALATKHTAVLLPFALGLHYVIAGVRAAGGGFFVWRWRVIVSLAVLGPVVLVAVWPWLWLAPYGHIKEWLQFHLEHVHYNFEYLGHNWNAPRFPWHIALVTTLFTVPVATVGASLIGASAWARRRRDHADQARMPGLLLLLSAVASMGPFFLGSTPIFGAEKHWMPALPSLCIAAGVGVVWAARRLAALVPGRAQRAVVPGVVGLVVLAAVVESATAQPYGLTWYNALAGGAPGAADLGMNRQFWGVAARGVLPVLDDDAPGRVVGKSKDPGFELFPGGPKLAAKVLPVYTHDATPAWAWYMKRRELWPWLPDSGHELAGIQHSQYALVIHEKHFNRHDYLIWRTYGTVQPMFVLRSAGVPIVSLYKRP